jgi:hypothetical protein
LVLVVGYDIKIRLMHFEVQLEKLAAGSTKIFISNGGIVA